MSTPIRVAIVEDDPAFRESLAVLINGAPGFRCLGVHANAEAALRELPQQKPEVVLMDIRLPRMSGIECVARLKALLPATQFLMLTVHEDSEAIFKSLQAGASGYLVKQTSPAELLGAIADVHRGGSPMSSHIARKVICYFQEMGPGSPELKRLSGREQQILDLLAKGYRYKEIADALALALPTVRAHVRHIYEKLHVHSRTEAVVKFLRR